MTGGDETMTATSPGSHLMSSPTLGGPPTTIDWEARRQKMNTLCEMITDFEKHHNPAKDSRYLILEGSSITEHSSTNSPKSITLFLFNDALVTATKKPRLAISTSAKKLSLLHFWPLSELVVTDIPDSKHLTNAFRITRTTGSSGVGVGGGESIVLVTETASSKRLWMQQIIRTQKSSILDRERETIKDDSSSIHSRPKSIRAESPIKARSPRPDSPRVTPSRMRSGTAGSISLRPLSPPALLAENHEWVERVSSLLDALAEAIATSQYDVAVEQVDQIKYELAQTDQRSPLVARFRSNLQENITRLTSYLCHEIASPTATKNSVAAHIQRLVVLGMAREARETFLASRTDTIKEKVRQVRLIGDIKKSIQDISFITFSIISSSAEWYVSAFKDNVLMAGNYFLDLFLFVLFGE